MSFLSVPESYFALAKSHCEQQLVAVIAAAGGFLCKGRAAFGGEARAIQGGSAKALGQAAQITRCSFPTSDLFSVTQTPVSFYCQVLWQVAGCCLVDPRSRCSGVTCGPLWSPPLLGTQSAALSVLLQASLARKCITRYHLLAQFELASCWFMEQ